MILNNPMWVAPQDGDDRRDENVLRATAWLKSFVPTTEWEDRIERTRDKLIHAKDQWVSGLPAALFDIKDAAAWQIFQAEAFATDRRYWLPEAAALVIPIMTRIGRELELLQTIGGVEDRAARLMGAERRQSDAGLFELLVALAYRRNGWTDVSFVSERPGAKRTPDLTVSRPRRRWAVECKRLGASTYATAEKARGDELARAVHKLSLAANRSIVLEVVYHRELTLLPDDHLVDPVAAFLKDSRNAGWSNSESTGRIRDINWQLARRVLAHDYVYFGSSRMIELLVGTYNHHAEHSMAAIWRPAEVHPFFADSVDQASVVSWQSRSKEAVSRKARHFLSTVGGADGQLPSDMPGVIHIGVESRGDAAVETVRHILNRLEICDFKPAGSRLRWVYGNYFTPELTTWRDETWAIDETRVPYKIGHHSVGQPLPHHMLLTPEADTRLGVHWDGVDES